MGGEACFLCIGGENSLCDVCTLRTGCGRNSSSLGGRACLELGLCACCPGHTIPSSIAAGLRSDTDRMTAAFFLPTSDGGSGASSPPSPITSGAVLANPTLNPSLLLGLRYPLHAGVGGDAAAGLSVKVAARRTSCAPGHRCAIAISIFGLLFSVEGFRKSTTSSFNLNELTLLGPGGGCSFSLNTLPHLLLLRNRERFPSPSSAMSFYRTRLS